MVNYMNKIVLLLLLSLSLVAANIDNLAKKMGFERDYNIALIKAKTLKKPLVMILGADYCPWCRKFEHKTLSSSLIKPRLQKEFVVLIVDKKYDIDTFPSKYRTKFTPRVFFINPQNEDIFFDTTGYVKKEEFAESLDNVSELYKESK